MPKDFKDPVQTFGQGLIGVFQYPKATGIFSVLPTKIIDLKEGIYPFSFAKSIYTNMNPQIIINSYEGVSLEKFEKLLKGEPVTGMSISGLMTANIWPFKETTQNIF